MNKKDINEKGILKRLDEFKDYPTQSSSEGKISDSRGIAAIPQNADRNRENADRSAKNMANPKPTGSADRKNQILYSCPKCGAPTKPTWTWPRLCLKCNYVFDIRRSKTKTKRKRQCPNCRGYHLKAISREEAIKRIATVKDGELETEYRILWTEFDKKIMEERYRIAKRKNIPPKTFIKHLINLVGIPEEAATLITNYFYQKEYLKELIRK